MGFIVGIVLVGALAGLGLAGAVALSGDEDARRAAPTLVLVAVAAAAIGFGMWAGTIAEARLGAVGIAFEVEP